MEPSKRGIGLPTARRIAMGLIDPALWSNSASHSHGETALAAHHAIACTVGICLELPTSRPSNVEIAEVLGCAVTRVREARDRWYDLTWRERYGWLVLAEAWHGRSSFERG